MMLFKKYIPFFIALIFICGCKKVLEVSLKDSEPQIVITGEVNNLPGPYRVSISRSVNFAENNDFPPISGALVTIKNKRITDTLSEDEPGKYFTKRIKGKPGESYTLRVELEGKAYTATSVMPLPVELDSISFLLGRKNTIYPVANFQDPPGVHNYYQFIEYIDGATLKNGRGNSVFDDRLSDGRYITSVIYNDSSVIKTGATLTVQMNCIDEKVYTYMSELLQITTGGGGGFGSPAPANPDSNISGGALGYFSANSVSSKTVTIQ